MFFSDVVTKNLNDKQLLSIFGVGSGKDLSLIKFSDNRGGLQIVHSEGYQKSSATSYNHEP